MNKLITEMLALWRELSLQLKKLKEQHKDNGKNLVEATKVCNLLKTKKESYEKAIKSNEERIGTAKDPADVSTLKEILDRQKSTLEECETLIKKNLECISSLQEESEKIEAERDKIRNEKEDVRKGIIRLIQIETSVVSDRDVLIALAATAREISFSQRRIISKIHRIDGIEPQTHRSRRRARWARNHKQKAS
jgi:hypothetical protein